MNIHPKKGLRVKISYCKPDYESDYAESRKYPFSPDGIRMPYITGVSEFLIPTLIKRGLIQFNFSKDAINTEGKVYGKDIWGKNFYYPGEKIELANLFFSTSPQITSKIIIDSLERVIKNH